MAKLKVKLARRQDDCDPAVVSWLQAHDIRFSDRKHYADLPQVPEGSLYDTDSDVTGVAMKHYLCPLSRDIMVYHTLDHRHYYTEGGLPKPVRLRMVLNPVVCVELAGNDVVITRRSAQTGQNVASLVEETLYKGKISNLPPHLRPYEYAHRRSLTDAASKKASRNPSGKQRNSVPSDGRRPTRKRKFSKNNAGLNRKESKVENKR